MKYEYSVIGDNTQENREWLEKVGFAKLGAIQRKLYLVTDNEACFYSGIMVGTGYPVINCIGNSPLFKAVSAMRDDSDFGQLFECKDGLFICQYETSREHIDKECKGWNITNLKKFNLDELQERFKEKER